MQANMKIRHGAAQHACTLLFWVVVCCLAAGCCSAKGKLPMDEVELRQRVGQLLMVGFRGTQIDSEHFIAKALQHDNLGGVILFDYDIALKQRQRNISSPEQLHSLTQTLHHFATTPPLIAVDQEGGRIARLKPRAGFAHTISHQVLGKLNDPSATQMWTDILVDDLITGGINLNLAPVVDLCSNPDNPVIAEYGRCFSANPDIVTQQAQAFIEAHHTQGVLTALKHFPGHGSSSTDSHAGFVDVSTTWRADELEPYRNLIKAGVVDTVMTAHVFNKQLDSQYPATLSRPVITGLLREKLGFDAVVFSDDMQMKAITESYNLKEAVGLAFNAGVDVLVFGNNLAYDEDIVPRTVDIIVELVKEGKVPIEIIDAACTRVHNLKQRLPCAHKTKNP